MALIVCRECGAQVSSTAKACPQCGAPVAKKGGIFKKVMMVCGGLVVGLWVLGMIVQNNKPAPAGAPSTAAATAPQATAAVQRVAAPAAPVKPALPATEAAFVSAIEQARADYRAASTDFQKGATRPARMKAICKAVPDTTVSNWVGTISTLSTNNDGKGVIAIEVARDIALKTWNNSLSDIGDKTLIEPGTPLFQTLGTLKTGDVVVFSGTFAKSESDCYRETSITLDGSMRDPEFVMRFRSIAKP